MVSQAKDNLSGLETEWCRHKRANVDILTSEVMWKGQKWKSTFLPSCITDY